MALSKVFVNTLLICIYREVIMDIFVSIQLDRSLDTPLYIQIYNGLVELIENKTLNAGEKLPPIRQMASFFNVNAVTVVNAYKRLDAQGYVESRVGSGTYVRFPTEKSDPEELKGTQGITGFPEEAAESIYTKQDSWIKFDFAGASISPKYFPVKDFKEVVNEILDRDGGYALEYQKSSGYQPLRESIKSFMKIQHNLSVPLEEIQIVSGAQQGIDILAKAFLNYRDVVYVEAPTYPGAINAFKSRDARIVEINMQEDGVDLDELKKNIVKNPPKLFYSMPVFQNPTGYSYSLEKKKELLALSKEYDFYIIEDDHISDLYYNEKPALLKGLDDSHKIFYIKSFSKLFLPGLRMAFLWVPQRHFDKTALAKYSSDISSSGFSQRAMDLFLRKSLWSEHVNRLRKIFYQKWQKTHQSLEKYMPKSIKVYCPQGGHFFWVKLPKGLYSMNLYHEVSKKGVSIMPGDLFFMSQRPSEGFRLSIAQIATRNIEEGITLLAESITQLMDNPHGVFQGFGDRPLL
jgi:2-aminoadipate transaminase